MLASNQNQDELNASNITVQDLDPKKNRSLIAKRDFSKGDVIVVEKPLVSAQFVWNEFYNYKACEYCMKPLENTEENIKRLTNNQSFKLPHPECCETNKSLITTCERCQIEYCCNECKLAAFNSYHEVLCLGEHRHNPQHPINILLDVWRQMHLPPETTTITLILKILAMLKKTSDRQSLMKKFFSFQSHLTSNEISHKLLNEQYFQQIEELRNISYNVFKNYLFVEECDALFSTDGFKQLFALIGRNAQGIATSPLSVWVNNVSNLKLNNQEKKQLDKFIDQIYDDVDKVSGTFLNSEGTGLYEIQSIANHSCAPNAEVAFKSNNNVLCITALKDIKAGEEILNSYLDQCDLQRSRHSRQKLLRENYLFNCECERCLSEINDPDVTSEEDDDDDDDDDEYEDDEDMES